MVNISNIYACTLHVPRDEDTQRALANALEEDSNNASRSSQVPAAAPPVNVDDDLSNLVIQKMGIYTSKMWKPGRTLRVLLRGGTPKVRAKVMENAVIWSKYANIKFQFVSSLPAEIRVGFKKGDGSWSWLGTDALLKPDSANTMNFGWFNDDTSDVEFSRTTLHEFGHALGCVHEHSQPKAVIHWDKDAVYSYYWETARWTKADVDFQIFTHYKRGVVSSTNHDTCSIMHYPVDISWTTDGLSVGYNNHLSEQDKAYIQKMYPFSPHRYRTGIVGTPRYHPSHKPKQDYKFTVDFEPPYSTPHKVLLGLNRFAIGSGSRFRISAHLESNHNDKMTIRLHAWKDTVMYSSGCAWLSLPTDDDDLQMGTFSTADDHPTDKPLMHTSRMINFTRPYAKPPTVLVWLNALCIDQNKIRCVKALASKITTKGFNVHIDSWNDTDLYFGRVSYVAFSSDRSDICGGTFSTSDIRDYRDVRHDNSAHLTFSKAFKNPPRVFMAVRSLHMGREGGLRIMLSANNITKTGMTWHINSWGDTKMYAGAATYVAIAND